MDNWLFASTKNAPRFFDWSPFVFLYRGDSKGQSTRELFDDPAVRPERLAKLFDDAPKLGSDPHINEEAAQRSRRVYGFLAGGQ